MLRGEILIRYHLTGQLYSGGFNCGLDISHFNARQRKVFFEGLRENLLAQFNCDCKLHALVQDVMRRNPDQFYPCGKTDYTLEKILIHETNGTSHDLTLEEKK